MSTEITLVVMLVASVAVASYVAWPLLAGKGTREPDGAMAEIEGFVDDLLVQKEATYGALKELEFDHAMGNLSARDYRELASRYEDKALALLKAIDEVAESQEGGGRAGAAVAPAVVGVHVGSARRDGLEDAIEREVASLRRGPRARQGRRSAPEDEIEREVAALRVAKQPFAGSVSPAAGANCPACGTPLKSPSAAFCSRCGASLQARCPACGEPADEGDLFCSTCGSPLTRGEGRAQGKPVRGGDNG